MPFINFTNVATMLLTLVVFLLALVLSKETKKSGIIATMLSVFLIILVCHAVELGTISNITEEMHYAMTRSILVDFNNKGSTKVNYFCVSLLFIKLYN